MPEHPAALRDSLPRRSDLDMMAMQMQTLFRMDERGQLMAVNEPGAPLAPRFFLGRTRQGNLWRFRHDLPADLVAELDRLCRAEPLAADLSAPPVGYAAMRAVLEERAPITEEYRGPCYRFPDELPDLPGAVELTEGNAGALPPEWMWLRQARAQYAPAAVVLEGGRAVAVCFCSRIGSHACEAGLETLPEAQRRGYGAAVTSLWAQLVRARDLTPLYSTSWDNQASQGVARRLGLVMYGEDFSLT